MSPLLSRSDLSAVPLFDGATISEWFNALPQIESIGLRRDRSDTLCQNGNVAQLEHARGLGARPFSGRARTCHRRTGMNLKRMAVETSVLSCNRQALGTST